MRPAFCVWGYVAAAGIPTDEDLKPLLTAAGSLDVLHVSALIHDDLMDSSDLRRGRPAAHRQFEALHANAGWLGRLGCLRQSRCDLARRPALMVGSDAAAPAWSSALERALPIVEAMRTEVTCGQYLDMVAQAHPLRSGRRSGRPTIELAWTTPAESWSTKLRYRAAPIPDRRAIGGGDDELYFALGAYGSPLGRPSSSATTCWVSSGIRSHRQAGRR